MGSRSAAFPVAGHLTARRKTERNGDGLHMCNSNPNSEQRVDNFWAPFIELVSNGCMNACRGGARDTNALKTTSFVLRPRSPLSVHTHNSLFAPARISFPTCSRRTY